ncbi:hypothetical protein B0A54_14126 [Friedmanniomyces endolithicus]|uniref:Uncharacterized protein n=1 Tax=Friedmanniomyces endolithicus TaxID=329885 RepID=A0A4V5N5V5_9PEZI|nr:hypothetical protein LTS09_012672 [Friedmanniomyces endolithicus]TKA33429.1 hypothetical protein B0A54_14126 [Friedmanniomyces endolithicus]
MALKPPRINTQDPGAHDLSGSDDEHFSSASEGDTLHPSRKRLSTPSTPITRVERVDDQPAYGEVPGTQAYSIRTADAVPDEVEIVPEGLRSRSGTRSRAMSNLGGEGAGGGSRPQTPGGTPVPKTVVERVDDKPAHGEVEGTLAHEMRLADAEPDEVLRAPEVARDGTIGQGRYDERPVEDHEVDPEQQQAWFRSMWEGKQDQGERVQPTKDEAETNADDEEHEADENGDDFDDFNEGGGEDDFGDFDEAEEAESTPIAEAPSHPSHPPAPPDILAGLPHLDFSNLTPDQTKSAIQSYLLAIFPPTPPSPKPLPALDPTPLTPFLSPRSQALWQQLVSPPPMAPPNWTRSRIRRLFLVSLGVPVDLDEILPPSKQKRLVLPNINLGASWSSPRASTAVERLKEGGANDSTTSLASTASAGKKQARRQGGKGPPPPPDFELNAAALLCRVTEQAMQGYGDEELREFVGTLEGVNQRASEVLEYWVQRKDEGLREKEVLEGVVGNLVGFVKGRRGG